jgi:predicted transglutaminase-like cysteine proteinase
LRRFALSTAVALAVLGGPLPLAPARAAAPALFGTAEFRTDSLAALPQWRGAIARMSGEAGVLDACGRDARACPSAAAEDWMRQLRRLDGASAWEQVRAVNRYANERPYRPDGGNWGRSDYWASPLEFLRRSGDCEDYAIFKYASLRRLGWPADRLRLVVVEDTSRSIPHAVLAVYLDDEAFILDNLTDAILPQTAIGHYLPYYSINEMARWAHAQPDALVVTARAVAGR